MLKRKLRDENDAGGAGTEGTGDGGGQETQSWRDALPEDIREDKTLGRYDDQEKANRGLIEAQKEISRLKQDVRGRAPATAVVVPGEGATPDQIKAYHEAVGIPENADGYELSTTIIADPAHPEREPVTIPEADVTSFRELCHSQSITKAQATAVMDFYKGITKRNVEGAIRAEQTALEEGSRQLTETYGDQLPAKRASIDVVKALVHDSDPARVQTLNDLLSRKSFPAGLGNDPQFQESMFRIAEKTGANTGERIVRGTDRAGGGAIDRSNVATGEETYNYDEIGPLKVRQAS